MQRKINKQPTTLESILIECIVVLSPETQSSAGYCCSALRNLLEPEQGSSHELASSSYSRREDQETFIYAPQNDDARNSSTIIYQSRSARAVTLSLFIRSKAPPPESLILPGINPQYREFERVSSSAIRQYDD